MQRRMHVQYKIFAISTVNCVCMLAVGASTSPDSPCRWGQPQLPSLRQVRMYEAEGVSMYFPCFWQCLAMKQPGAFPGIDAVVA